MFCGHFPGTGPSQFHIFDTYAPAGSIASYFPNNAEIVDISKTTGHVRLFDTIMADPERNYVVDLQSHHLKDFFETYQNIQFGFEALSAGLGTVVYFMLDRDSASVKAAHDLENSLHFSEFALVRNDAMERRAQYDPNSDLAHALNHLRTIRLPELSDPLLQLLERVDFNLFDFMAGNETDITYEVRLELWNLLDFFYTQRRPDGQGFTHFL